jgi:nucleotide-binding universal stress UspA family protein
MEDSPSGDVYHSKPKRSSRTLVCAVDGSEGSNLAFHTMMTMKKRFDTVCLFHTYSLDKEDSLPPHFRKDELRSYYENELLRTYQMPVGKFTFDWVDRRGHTVNEILVELLNEYNGIRNPMTPTRQAPNFFFCGYSGRKKSASFHDFKEVEEGNESNLGSTANFASRNLHVPVVISKKAIPDEIYQRCFVVGVDGTPLSKRGFHLLLQLVGPRDIVKSLYISCVSQESKHDDLDPAFFDDYREEASRMSPEIEFTFETLVCPDTSIPITICDYAHDHLADFLAISPRATGDLSSISEQIILLSHCSVILTKN